jgi:hypothetical protein
MSESSFTCPGLRESVLAWRLILIYFSRTIGTKHDRDVNTVVINNLHHFTYILSFYHFIILHIFYIQFTSFLFHFGLLCHEMFMIFSYPSLKSITKMNFIFLILSVHVLIKAELVFIIKLICCDECNHFHFLFVLGWSFAFNKI